MGSKTKNILITVTVFTITMVSFFSLKTIVEKSIARENKERAAYMTQALASSLEKDMESYLYPMDVWDLLIRTGHGKVYDFESVCDNIRMDKGVVRTIELAPGGVTAYRYPVSENDKTEDLQSSIVVRIPVYITDQRQQAAFWGLVIMHLNTDGIMKAADFDRLVSEQYEYKLLKKSSLAGAPEVLSASSDAELIDPVSAQFRVMDGETWVLEVTQKGGWVSQVLVIRHNIFIVVLCSLISTVVWLMLSLKSKERELLRLSYKDSLTSLYNPRKYFNTLGELQKKHSSYGLIYMDINDFKSINDTCGHQTGDALLNVIAKRLEKCISAGDSAFRVGGDEFAVLVNGAHEPEYFEELIRRIRSEAAREIQIGTLCLKVSISAGYARCPEDAFRFEDIVRNADQAMYEQKRRDKQKRS